MSDRHGFALVAVMLVLGLLGVIVAEFALSMRLEAAMVRSYKETMLARNLAEAGVEQAIREVLSHGQIQGLDEDGQLAFYRMAPGQTVPARVPRLERMRVALGPGEFSYRITDEEARLNLNASQPERIDRLLAALGLDKKQRDVVSDSLQDWKDPNDEHRLNGAESEDTYLKRPVPYRARNGSLQDPAELLQINGVTPELYIGTPDRPGLAGLVTVHGRGTVNINTAPALVLTALGLSSAEVTDIVQARTGSPHASVPARFAGRGLGVSSSTFRIEAEGLVAGAAKVRLYAIVHRGREAPPSALPAGAAGRRQAPAVAVLSWRQTGEAPWQ